MTYAPPRRQFGNKTRSKQDKRAALVSRLVMCRSLVGLTADGLARQHGLSVAECSAALEEQRKRREGRL